MESEDTKLQKAVQKMIDEREAKKIPLHQAILKTIEECEGRGLSIINMIADRSPNLPGRQAWQRCFPDGYQTQNGHFHMVQSSADGRAYVSVECEKRSET